MDRPNKQRIIIQLGTILLPLRITIARYKVIALTTVKVEIM